MKYILFVSTLETYLYPFKYLASEAGTIYTNEVSSKQYTANKQENWY